MKTLVPFGVSVILLCLILTVGLRAQNGYESILDRPVKIDPMFDANICSALHDLANQGIPIGFEAAVNWNVDKGPRLSLKSGRLFDVLNSISQQDPSYKWQEVDGVINFSPSIDRDKRAVSFLDTRISSIVVNKGDERAHVVESLRKLFNKGERDGFRFVSAVGAGNHLGLPDKFEEKVDISASDMKTVLNKLIKLQAYSPIWRVMRYSNQDELTLVF